MDTIDQMHSKILNNIENLAKCKEKILQTDPEIIAHKLKINPQFMTKEELNIIKEELTQYNLKQIKTKYLLETNIVLEQYEENIIDIDVTRQNYANIINNIEVVNQIEFIAKKYRKIYPNTKIFKLNISKPQCMNDLFVCDDCGGQMNNIQNTCQIECEDCGKMEPVIGIEFGTYSIYQYESHANQKKRDQRDPKKHYYNWMNNIFGKIQPKNYDEVRQKIVDYKERCNKDLRKNKKPQKELRNILKKLGLTKFNDYTTYILKDIWDIHPPEFSIDDLNRHSSFYDKIIKIYNKIFIKSDKKNCPYCPFFIGHIFYMMFPYQPEKLQILNFIHRQEPKTMKKREEDFRLICLQDDELEYKPLDTAKF